MGRHAHFQEERIHSQDHSFQAFDWQGLFGHFFGQIHQPVEWDKGKTRRVRRLALCKHGQFGPFAYMQGGFPGEAKARRGQGTGVYLPYEAVKSKPALHHLLSPLTSCSFSELQQKSCLYGHPCSQGGSSSQLIKFWVDTYVITSSSKDQGPTTFASQGSRAVKASSLASNNPALHSASTVGETLH